MGAANILWVPLANTFGRRPITLFNILLLMLCSVWAARATSFGSLLAARFFMGVGVAPADTSEFPSFFSAKGSITNGVASCTECRRRNLFCTSERKSDGRIHTVKDAESSQC